MPWDEMLLALEASQEVEADSGPAASMAAMLADLLAGMMGG